MATKTEKLLTDIRAAADHLRATDAPDLADTIDGLLGPSGWQDLRRALSPARPNEPIFMDAQDLDAYQAAAEAADTNLSAVVTEGLRAFIAGDFSPAAYPRRGKSSGASRNLNFRLSAELRESFKQAAADRKDELGYVTTIGHVAKAWLAQTFPQPAKK
jgi:hypothetical protein